MPFYEYECSNCKFYTEVLQKVSDPQLKKCPSCKKTTMKKLVSAPVFRLKGGGWYETDFKSDKEGRRNLAVDKEPAANDSSMESKAAASKDGKPADAKASDSKPAEGKSESKASDSKPSESKPSETRSSSASRSRHKPSAPAKRTPPARGKSKPKASGRSKRR
jgi:putative FmdB family regulatory protein